MIELINSELIRTLIFNIKKYQLFFLSFLYIELIKMLIFEVLIKIWNLYLDFLLKSVFFSLQIFFFHSRIFEISFSIFEMNFKISVYYF